VPPSVTAVLVRVKLLLELLTAGVTETLCDAAPLPLALAAVTEQV
jgi:hypothetical protein